MEQLELYLVLLCCVTAVLSLVALHRMKKVSKQVQMILDNEVRMLAWLDRQQKESEEVQQGEQYRPEELIDAVLGEIFP